MKKKMTVLGVLALAVAITASQVGGTYAKYISSYGTTDQARVAKWDFNETNTNTVDLFQQSYTNENGTFVASKDAYKVVAPGTEGEYSYSVKGTAEVNFKVVNTLKIENNVVLKDENDNVIYDPIEFSTDGGKTWVKAAEITAVDSKTVYAANTEATAGGQIAWRWAFDNDEADHIVDDYDTILAEKAVKENLTIKATIETTIEQTKEAPTAGPSVKYASVSNIIPAADAKDLATNWGYVASNAKDVYFTGNQLMGSIKETTTAKSAEMMGAAAATGYYYAVNIKGETGYKLTFSGANGNDKTATFDGDSLSIMISLRESGNQVFKYSVYTDQDVKVGDYQIDYSGLTFVPANN